MKVWLSDNNEWYPMNEISLDCLGVECEVPDEVVRRWQETMEKLDLMQKEIKSYLTERT